MKTRRVAMASVALAAIIGLTGCGPKSESSAGRAPAAGSSASALAQPSSEFEAAVARIGDTPVKVTMTMLGGMGMTGAVDAKAHRAELTTAMGTTGSMVVRQVGTDLYVKASGQLASLAGGPSGTWMHIDTSKVGAASPLNLANSDPKTTAKMLTGSTDVQKTGDHTFAGKVDFTKSPTFRSAGAAADTSGLTGKLKAVPFTARTDDQGRLVNLTFDLESLAPGVGKMTTEYSDFGTPVDVQAPPSSQVVPMPEKFRRAMGG
nr:hypothetical protein [uncultured Actinoplanes sp.]